MSEHAASDRFHEQLPKNLIANVANFLISIIIGIFLVPYFIGTLGIAAYGLIPLTSAIMGYVAIIIQSLDTTVSRYLIIDLQNGDFPAANRTFNTAFLCLSLIIALMIPVVLVVSYFIPVIFNVPAGQETGTIILFICASGAFFLRSLNGTYTVQLFACNRIDYINLVNIVNFLVQVILIVIFFSLKGPTLEYVGFAYIGGALVSSAVAIVLAKKTCPYLFLSIRSFDRTRIQDLWNMGGWVFIHEIGALLFIQIDLIVVNLVFGAVSSGEYAIPLQLVYQLRVLAVVFTGVLTPMILTFYAREKIGTMIRVSQSSVKLMGLIMALPLGLICGFAPQILTIWVGSKYAFLAPLLVLMAVPLIVNIPIMPVFSIRIAYNRVKIPAFVSLFMGFGNFVLALLLALYSGWGYYGIAVAGGVMLTLTNSFFNPWYAARILKIPTQNLVKPIVPGILAMAGIIGVAFIISSVVHLTSFPLFLGVILIFCGVYSLALVFWGLDNFERNLLHSYIPESLRRFFKYSDIE